MEEGEGALLRIDGSGSPTRPHFCAPHPSAPPSPPALTDKLSESVKAETCCTPFHCWSVTALACDTTPMPRRMHECGGCHL